MEFGSVSMEFGSKLCRSGIKWFNDNCSFLWRRLAVVIQWYRYNIFFSKGAVFVSGLVFGQSFVEYAVVAVMMTFITNNLPKENLRTAAAIVNFQEGLTTFMALVISHISDAFSSRNTLAITNAFYVIGLVLFWLSLKKSIPSTMICLFWSTVLIAIGKAAEKRILKAFLSDQLCEQEENPQLSDQEENPDADEKVKRVKARSRVWWVASWVLGAAATVLLFSMDARKHTLMVSAMVMGVSYLFFLCGVPFYNCKKSEGSLLTIIFWVFKAAISNRHLDYPTSPSQYYKSENKFPRSINSLCRCLDKAAIVTCSPGGEEEEERKGKLCTVKQVEDVKCLLNMVPMWSTFLVYSLVEATERTFFLEQTSNLNRFIGDSFKVPDISLIILQSFTRSTISSLLIKLKVATRVRIIVGMVFSMFCCMAACLVENHRLALIHKRGLFDDKNTSIGMSIFWLVPQFFLFGVMAGLARNGLNKFLTDQLGETLARDGYTINECVFGTGKFITIYCVFFFRGWFGETINKSHLDYYYIMLAVLNFVNLLFSFTVFKFYDDSREVGLDIILVDK